MTRQEVKYPELRKNLASFGFFVFCALCFFGFKLTQGYVLAPEDDFVQNYPAFASPGRLWTPLLLTGFPLLADPQIQFFYPLAWLAKQLPLGGDLTANFNLYMISAFVLAAFFAALLARKLTGSFYGGLIAGLSYGFSGYFVSELKHVQVLHTAIWLPLMFYLIELARSRFEPESAEARTGVLSYPAALFVLSLAVACTIFAGHPQTALYVLATALAYSLMVCFSAKTARARILFLLPLLLAAASGAAMSAIQILPSLELSSFSDRTQFSYRDFVIGQVEPMQVVGFVIPYILGGAYGILGNLPFAEQGPPPGLLFFGFAPLILAIHGAINNDKQKKQIWFFAGLAILAFILSLGAHTPLSRLVYYLPFFGSFRGLYRVLILFAFGISMLSAIGMAKVERAYLGEAPSKNGLNLSKMGLRKHLYIMLFIVLSCFSYPFFLGSLPLLCFFVHMERPAFLYRQNSSLRQNFLVLTVLASLASYALFAEWSKVSPKAAEFKAPGVAITYGAETAGSNSRIFTVKGLEGERDQLPPNLSRLWGVASATGYEPLIPSRYRSLLGISEGGFLQPPWHINGANLAFDMTCVRYMFAPWGDFSKRAFDDTSKQVWKLKQVADRTLIYENRRVLPRFYLVTESRLCSADGIHQSIVSGILPDGAPFKPRETVLLEDVPETMKPALPPSGSLPPAAATPDTNMITSYELGDEKLVFKVSLARGAYLVLADLFYPGWQATVDNQKVAILPANYVQRAVRLEGGAHTVIFKYEPESLARGGSICLTTLGAWLLSLLLALALKLAKR